MNIWVESSAKQVFRNARPGKNASSRAEFHTAKNAFISAQILLRDIAAFEIRGISVTDAKGNEVCSYSAENGQDSMAYIKKDENVRIFYQEYRMFNDSTAYPDEITENACLRCVPAHAVQGIWVDFYIPRDAVRGARTYKIAVNTSAGTFEAYITLIVHDVTLPPCDTGTFSHEYFFSIYNIPGFKRADMYTEEWWEALKKAACIFHEMRNNVVTVPLLQLLRDSGSMRTGRGKWHYDWSLFDRFTDVFIKAGCVKSFTISASIESVNGRSIESIGEASEKINIETPSEEGELFLMSLYSELRKHLEERQLINIFRAHIEDEPHTDNTWRWARAIIKRAAPEIPCGEPLDMLEVSKELEKDADLFIPRLDVYAQDPGYFRCCREKGRELWVYSCCFPEDGWWLNKFIDMPFIRSRLMEWVCKANGIDGFLHWGFNHWNSNTLYGVGPDARFKGDGNIVYPNDARACFNLSTRFINTRDGNQDAELIEICMCKDPENTERAVRGVCSDFENYSEDADVLLNTVKKLLEIAKTE